MVFAPVPGIGVPDLSIPERNWAHYIDSLYLPGVMWQGTWDPEGILSTFPSIVTGIFGLIAGGILVSKKEIKDKRFHSILWAINWFNYFNLFRLHQPDEAARFHAI